MELTDRVVMVTGAATGLGRAMALSFASQKVRSVAINYRERSGEAAAVAREVEALGSEAMLIRADVRDDAAVRSMVESIRARFGRLDVLINNAGTTRWVPFADLEGLSDQTWHEILDVNVVGAFRCARAAAPLLTAGEGAIVNIASISGVLALDTASSIAYSASKAALISLTKSLAIALAPHVRVNAVAPAFTDTAWMRDHFGASYDERVAAAARSFPLGRIARPDDVARAVVALVTAGDYITGHTLMIDGGRSIV